VLLFVALARAPPYRYSAACGSTMSTMRVRSKVPCAYTHSNHARDKRYRPRIGRLLTLDDHRAPTLVAHRT